MAPSQSLSSVPQSSITSFHRPLPRPTSPRLPPSSAFPIPSDQPRFSLVYCLGFPHPGASRDIGGGVGSALRLVPRGRHYWVDERRRVKGVMSLQEVSCCPSCQETGKLTEKTRLSYRMPPRIREEAPSLYLLGNTSCYNRETLKSQRMAYLAHIKAKAAWGMGGGSIPRSLQSFNGPG